MNRWRGLAELLRDAVVHGSSAVEKVHRGVADTSFDVLEAIPSTAVPARAVRLAHDAVLTVTYGAVRLGARAGAKAAQIAIAAAEALEPPSPPTGGG